MKRIIFISMIFIYQIQIKSQNINLSVDFTPPNTLSLSFSRSVTGSVNWSGLKLRIETPPQVTLSINSNPFSIAEDDFDPGNYFKPNPSNLNFNPGPITIATFTVNGTGGPHNIVVSGYTFESSGTVNLTGSLTNNASGILLPITLKSFTATKLEGSNAILDWTTSSEVDASHFEIERSFDLENWKSLGTEEARGQNGVETNYSFLDQNIIAERSSKGVVYYRIQMIDLDKSKKTSDIRSINLDPLKETYYQAFPNPASGKLHVQLKIPDTKEDMTELLFIDNAGKVQSNTKISTNGITTFDVRDLPKGVYHLQVKSGAEVHTKKVILMDN